MPKIGTHRSYRGHRLVASSDPKKKGVFNCVYCGEKIREDDYWAGAQNDSARVECKRHPDYKPLSMTTTQKIGWV